MLNSYASGSARPKSGRGAAGGGADLAPSTTRVIGKLLGRTETLPGRLRHHLSEIRARLFTLRRRLDGGAYGRHLRQSQYFPDYVLGECEAGTACPRVIAGRRSPWVEKVKSYTIFVSGFDQHEQVHVDLFADTPASAFDWVEQNAPGLDFELFEDSRSLARVHHVPADPSFPADEPTSPE